MKKNSLLTTLAAFIFVLITVAAIPLAKNFNGKIHYKISTNLPADHPYAEMMPQQAVYTIADEKIKMDVSPTAPGAGAIYLNSKELTMRMLLDVPGNKFQVIMDEDYKLREQDQAQVQYIKETRNIAGYKCQKALIISDVDTTEVWYTDKVNVLNGGGMWNKLKGFPLEFTMHQDGSTLSYTATKVEESKIDAAEVLIPEGYVPVTMQQLQALFSDEE
ncbi:MAG: DUF4412 domain-containing protein [Hymenobacteraceae bacterium]|nr:DUF4412 domain-containing protein [Hymenobacteraceae bacterium]MDX5394588.1 DUF4412 domain-containing protein [Hymenobacteraceae bacterium]MDX5510616.1 DUF4412 domain-containing protein [Hymenobacteraceae bacterium]